MARYDRRFNSTMTGMKVDDTEKSRIATDATAEVYENALDEITVPADGTNEVAEGTLGETITALAARIKALEDAAQG